LPQAFSYCTVSEDFRNSLTEEPLEPVLSPLRFPTHQKISLSAVFAIQTIADRRANRPSRFLVPEFCTREVLAEASRRKVSFTYGGFRENREDFLRGSYITKEEKHIHLGVDFNVPAGTPVYASSEAQVVRVDPDPKGEEQWGWGTRIILKLKDCGAYLIYGHLQPSSLVHTGKLQPGWMVGTVAPSAKNGKWFEHFHLQAMTEEGFAYHAERAFKELDGYARQNDEVAYKHFIDPLPFIALP
jgi:murein DD-endopeptidase MepM/ murein hydrolase activator NlpD